MKLFNTLAGLLCLAFISLNLHAHELSTSFISASVNNLGKVNGQLKVRVLDIKDAVPVDLDKNGELTWGEIELTKPLIFDYIVRHFSLSRNEKSCKLHFNNALMLQQQTNGSYIVMPFVAQCETQGDLTLNYRLLFDLFANHKSIVSLKDQNNEYLSVITQADSPTVFSVQSTSNTHAFAAFVYQGIFHILIGFDHILFLLTLLLSVVLYRDSGKWHPIKSKAKIFKRTLWIVSSFTLAHSLTLTGTALGLIPQFGSWIEVVIAASILFNVINNIFPLVLRLSFITFAFGLIHGMGFAGALAELGLPENQKTLTIIAFNIGVELGQIGLLLVVLPLLILCRKTPLYQNRVMPLLSLAIGVLAIYWIVNRL